MTTALDPVHDSAGFRIGVFGVGLDTYWGQFPGLRERLEGYLGVLKGRLEEDGTAVISAGLVDSVEKADHAARLFKTRHVQIIFLYVSTYALSSTILPVVRNAHVPVVVLNLQPETRIDYAAFNAIGDRGKMTGEWLAYCQACAIPEVASVFHRSGIPFHAITGTLHDAEAWTEIREWVCAARVGESMRQNRLGILGHYYNGMLDVYTDPTIQSSVFGTHIEHLEIGLLRTLRANVTPGELKNKIEEIHRTFEVSVECASSEIERAGRTACALDRLVSEKHLGSIAYYYEGNPGSEEEDIVTSMIVGTSLLTGRHIPVAGECEVKNVQAMKIMDALGAGGSFSEFYAMDFEDDVILLGHDGPGHIGIAGGKPILKPLGVYHGKPGNGLSVEMRVRSGPVTLLAVVQTSDGNLKLLIAEGESVAGPILHIGNSNSRYKFGLGVKQFVGAWSNEGPAHHCAIGVGHVGSTIRKLGAITGLTSVQIT